MRRDTCGCTPWRSVAHPTPVSGPSKVLAGTAAGWPQKLRGLNSQALAECCARLRRVLNHTDEVGGTTIALRAVGRRIQYLNVEITELNAELGASPGDAIKLLRNLETLFENVTHLST